MKEYGMTNTAYGSDIETGFILDQNSTEASSETEGSIKIGETSEATIRRVLSSYDLGKKLRQLRLQKKIALVDLGKHTGLSASMISQLENGKLVPTLPTLARIAMVFDVGLDYFFTDRKRRGVFSVVRADERIRFPDNAESPVPGYYFECLAYGAQDKSLQAYLGEFPKMAPGSGTEHAHEGAEFFHVLEGEVCIRYEDQDYVLRPGDSVYFDAGVVHSYRGLKDGVSKAIVITTPPRP